ncbi:hypothetical protein AK812_SmicGene45806 [Symbiodinium microadriaticum]|uniref:Uncharacterized protein n=1 Tax=Symbiodinium microadriaticum TaxID=2951 RepID=A0A1Q9BV87_SYMMI|nr:hypothetical protein AK812_SmicGene45806 [Symbiodinium microadriaticum]
MGCLMGTLAYLLFFSVVVPGGKEEMAGRPMPYAANYNYPNQGYGGYQQVYEQQYAPGQDQFGYNQPSPGFYGDCRPTVPEPVQCRPLTGYADPYAQPGYTQPGYSQMDYGAATYGQDVPYQQRQGMSSGTKMAMAGAGGLALGAGAVFAAEHAGDIAQFAEGAFDDVGRFAGDAAHGVEEFVEDIF